MNCVSLLIPHINSEGFFVSSFGFSTLTIMSSFNEDNLLTSQAVYFFVSFSCFIALARVYCMKLKGIMRRIKEIALPWFMKIF